MNPAMVAALFAAVVGGLILGTVVATAQTVNQIQDDLRRVDVACPAAATIPPLRLVKP